MRSTSAIVLGSGSVGPDASADSLPAGTSVTASVIFLASSRSSRQPPAFHRRKMFPHRVHRFNRRATGHQRAMHRLHILQLQFAVIAAVPSTRTRRRTAGKSPPSARRNSPAAAKWLPPTSSFLHWERGARQRNTPCPARAAPAQRAQPQFPKCRVPGGRMPSSPVTIAWAALPMATTYTFAIWERSMAASGRISRDPSRSNFLSITRGISMDASVCRKIRRAISFPVAINAPPAVSRLLQHRGIHHVRRHLPMEE